MSARSDNVKWHEGFGDATSRGRTVWMTGLPASGKSTLAGLFEAELRKRGVPAYVLDGDNLRHGLNGDLGFSAEDRAENVRRTGEIAALFADAGLIAVVSVVSPYAADRKRVRDRHESMGIDFAEVFVDTSLAECEARDPKGLYARARAGEISGMTGIDDPYETPERPELVVRPSAEGSLQALLDLVS